METSVGSAAAPPKKLTPLNKVLIGVAAIAVAVSVGVCAMTLSGKDEAANTPTIGYAADAKVLLDQDSLQDAVNEAMANAKNGNIALRYKNNAYSTDGTNFECYIVNAEQNAYDMFLTIHADAEMKDELFKSSLVPPGSGFEKISLEHPLDPGDHRVYVTLTQVETNENGAQTIVGQVSHTMDFHVTQ